MEQHPVPRNISSFQFHLIGDMTLRQFLYLAGGALLAFIIYKLSPFPSIIKITFAAICALSGFAFAFLPIQDRPLDRWLLAFIRSVFSPTQYLWKKEGINLEILATKTASLPVKTLPLVHIQANLDAKAKLHQYLSGLPSLPHQNLNTAEKRYIDNTLALFNTTFTPSVVSIPPSYTPIPTVPTPNPSADEGVEQIAVKPVEVRKPVVEDNNLQNQLSQLASEKKALFEELAKLKEELQKMNTPASSVVKPTPAVETKKPTIKTFTPAQAVNEVGMPNLPQAANLVIGVIKDAQKRLIPNLIITIKDNKGLPLRALKTNKLGQFSVATPLPNGTYLLEVEDPLKRYVFDIAQLTLSGRVFLPIEIIAKGEKEVLREKLTKELFGSANM